MAAKSPEAIQRHRDRSNARRLANPEIFNARGREWYQNNKGPELRAKRAAYDKARYHANPLVKIAKSMRGRLRSAFKRNKPQNTLALVGCSFEFLKQYLQERFQDNMSWENYGKWEIDHIIPLASATDAEDLQKLCHYTNLQPLWSLDNKKKLKKISRVG